MMISMNFLTLPYNYVTISYLPEIWFWCPTYPTFLYDVTLFSLFFLNSSLMDDGEGDGDRGGGDSG